MILRRIFYQLKVKMAFSLSYPGHKSQNIPTEAEQKDRRSRSGPSDRVPRSRGFAPRRSHEDETGGFSVVALGRAYRRGPSDDYTSGGPRANVVTAGEENKSFSPTSCWRSPAASSLVKVHKSLDGRALRSPQTEKIAFQFFDTQSS